MPTLAPTPANRHSQRHRHRHLPTRFVFLVWVCLYNVPETQHSYRPQANTQTKNTNNEECQHKERAGKAKRAFTPHPHTLFIHTHSLTITKFVLCIAFALFHTVFHHTSCHALRRLSTHSGGVFGLYKSLHTFGAVLLCCLLRRTVVITYEV